MRKGERSGLPSTPTAGTTIDAQQNSLEPGEERHIQAHVVCCQAFTPTRKLGFHNDTSRLAARRRTQPACAVNAIATATARTGWTPATVQGAR